MARKKSRRQSVPVIPYALVSELLAARTAIISSPEGRDSRFCSSWDRHSPLALFCLAGPVWKCSPSGIPFPDSGQFTMMNALLLRFGKASF
jgi:hypothetical protein